MIYEESWSVQTNEKCLKASGDGPIAKKLVITVHDGTKGVSVVVTATAWLAFTQAVAKRLESEVEK